MNFDPLFHQFLHPFIRAFFFFNFNQILYPFFARYFDHFLHPLCTPFTKFFPLLFFPFSSISHHPPIFRLLYRSFLHHAHFHSFFNCFHPSPLLRPIFSSIFLPPLFAIFGSFFFDHIVTHFWPFYPNYSIGLKNRPRKIKTKSAKN